MPGFRLTDCDRALPSSLMLLRLMMLEPPSGDVPLSTDQKSASIGSPF